MTHLFQKFVLANLELANRIVASAVTRTRASDEGVPSQLMADHYAARSSAGLIIAEATAVHPRGMGYQGMPGIFNSAQSKGWLRVLEAIGKQGPPIFMQLQHAGRVTHSTITLGGSLPMAPSAIPIRDEHIHTPQGSKLFEVPQEASITDIEEIKLSYMSAAKSAIALGFSGIEINCAFGNLLDTFVQSSTNHRVDSFGGSLQNRLRLPLLIVDAIISVVGQSRVGFRISPNAYVNGMGSVDAPETFKSLSLALNQRGIAYLHVTGGDLCGATPLHAPLDIEDLKPYFSGPVIRSSGYDLADAIRRIEQKEIDLCAFGRAFMSNPDLVERIQEGKELRAPPPMDRWYARDADGYTHLKMAV